MEALSKSGGEDKSRDFLALLSIDNDCLCSAQLPEDAEQSSIAGFHVGLEQEVQEEKESSRRLPSMILKKRNDRRATKRKGHLYKHQIQSEADVQSSIGDLVLAAELMEKVNEVTQGLGDINDSVIHDHGDYCVPNDPEHLKQIVKELKRTSYHQNQLLLSLQESLNKKQKECQELQEKWENERWMLLADMGQQISQLESEIKNLHCENEILEKKNKDLQEQLTKSSGTVLYLGQQVKERENQREEKSLCMSSIKNENKWVRFYTGFDSYKQLVDFLTFLTADQKLCAGKIQKRTEVGPQSALNLEDQLLLVLSRLRLGLLLQDLAFRFRVSESTVSRYWLNWTELLHARLTQIPITYSPRYLELFEPKRTIQHQGVTCTIMDCTDLFFEVQAKDRGRPASSHPCRNHYLRRGYAIASSNGFITFASSLPFGIATKVMDGQPQEDLAHGINPIKLPSFMRNTPIQLTRQQQELSRGVLSLLSLTDKVLNFRFLKFVYPHTMEAQVDRAWTICCYLACLLHDPMGLP